MYMEFKIINNFNDIEIELKTLIICDIDDTILKYNKDLNYFINLNNQTIDNIELSKLKAQDDYEFYQIDKYYDDISHTDLEGFYNMIEKINKVNGNIVFLTARHKTSDIFTRKQLDIININYNEFEIHYTGNLIPKGEYINKYINLRYYDKIIFIDDQNYNLYSVNEINPDIKCYKFEIN